MQALIQETVEEIANNLCPKETADNPRPDTMLMITTKEAHQQTGQDFHSALLKEEKEEKEEEMQIIMKILLALSRSIPKAERINTKHLYNNQTFVPICKKSLKTRILRALAHLLRQLEKHKDENKWLQVKLKTADSEHGRVGHSFMPPRLQSVLFPSSGFLIPIFDGWKKSIDALDQTNWTNKFTQDKTNILAYIQKNTANMAMSDLIKAISRDTSHPLQKTCFAIMQEFGFNHAEKGLLPLVKHLEHRKEQGPVDDYCTQLENQIICTRVLMRLTQLMKPCTIAELNYILNDLVFESIGGSDETLRSAMPKASVCCCAFLCACSCSNLPEDEILIKEYISQTKQETDKRSQIQYRKNNTGWCCGIFSCFSCCGDSSPQEHQPISAGYESRHYSSTSSI